MAYDEARLNQIIEQVNNLPSLPDVVYQVLDLVNDPESSISDLVEAILTDQAMTAKVLRLANSPYYGFVRKIETVTQAVAVLGKNDIGEMVLSTSLYGFLGMESRSNFDRLAFWRYCFAVAQTTKILLRLSSRLIERIYIMALLKDIGELVIDEYFPESYDEVLALAERNQWPLERAERDVMGFDHSLVGGLLCQRWNLPQRLVEVIQNHHQQLDNLPPGEELTQTLYVLHLADLIVRGEGIGKNYDFSPVEITDEMWLPLGLTGAHREKVVESLNLALNKLGAVIAL